MFLLNDKSTIITLQYMIYKQQPQRLGKDYSINESSLELEYLFPLSNKLFCKFMGMVLSFVLPVLSE